MLIGIVVALVLGTQAAAQPPPPRPRPTPDHVTVYRNRTCGCCGKWIDHVRAAGFDVTVHIVDDVDAVPGRNRVPQKLRSCHTGTAGRYAIEGHIPADVLKDLLRKRPAVDGIAVPGMPAGSPGMESPNPQPYEVMAFDKQGRTSTFARR